MKLSLVGTSPRPAKSWFEILYISMFHDRNIPVDYFRRQQRMKRGTIQALFGILTPLLTSWERIFDWGTGKGFSPGNIRLAHGNSYVSIGPIFNIGKSIVIEAIQDVVAALFELKNTFLWKSGRNHSLSRNILRLISVAWQTLFEQWVEPIYR